MAEHKLNVASIDIALLDDAVEYNLRDSVGDFSELVASFKAQGQLQPILVKPDAAGNYRVIAGFRRVAAAKSLGWTKINAQIMPKATTAQQCLLMNLSENVDRKQFDPLQEAVAMKKIIDSGMPLKELANFMGLRQAYVQDRLKLLGLPEAVRVAIKNEEISIGAGFEISRLPEEKIEKAIAFAKDATTSAVRKFVEQQLKKLDRQTESPTTTTEPGEQPATEAEHSRKVKKDVRQRLMEIARLYCPEQIASIEATDFALVPMHFLLMLRTFTDRIPTTTEQLEKDWDQYVTNLQTIEVPKDTLPTEPDFWGGPEGTVAKLFDRLVACAAEKGVCPKKVAERTTWIETQKAALVVLTYTRLGEVIGKTTQVDVMSLASALDVVIINEA